MNNETTNKKSSGRVHIHLLDVVLVLLTVLIAVSIWQKNNLELLFDRQKQERSYAVTFAIEGVRYQSAQYLETGDALYFYDGNNKTELGVLVDEPAYLPHVQTVQDAQGNTITVVYPDTDPARLVDVNATFVCYGYLRDAGLIHEASIYLKPDEAFLVSTERGDFTIKILTIVEI